MTGQRADFQPWHRDSELDVEDREQMLKHVPLKRPAGVRRNGYKRKKEKADKEMMVTEEKDKDFLESRWAPF